MRPVEHEAKPRKLGIELFAQPIASIGDSGDFGSTREILVAGGVEQLAYDLRVVAHRGHVGTFVRCVDRTDQTDSDVAPCGDSFTTREFEHLRPFSIPSWHESPRSDLATVELHQKLIRARPSCERFIVILSRSGKPVSYIGLGFTSPSFNDAKYGARAHLSRVVPTASFSGPKGTAIRPPPLQTPPSTRSSCDDSPSNPWIRSLQ